MLPTKRALAGAGAASMLAAVDEDPPAGPASHATVVRRTTPPPGTGSSDGPGEVQPGEVAPQRTTQRAAAVTKTKPTRRLQPGDLVCGSCGEGNPPTRKFCSRCGTELDPGTAVKPRWWQRLAFWRRGPKQMEAGTRPGEKGAKKGIGGRLGGGAKAVYIKGRAVFAAIMLVGGVVYLFVPPFRDGMNSMLATPTKPVVDWVKGVYGRFTDPYVTVPIESSTARGQFRDRTAGDAFDGNTNSWWAAPWKPTMREEQRPALVVEFADPVDLTSVIVHSGAPGEAAERFLLPNRLLFRYQSGVTEEIPLAFEPDAQVTDLEKGKAVTRITIIVAGTHVREGLKNVALSEIEFKARE